MGALQIVLLVIKLAPEIYSFVKACLVIKDGAVDLVATRASMQGYIAKATQAQETGDTSDVESIFNPKP